MEIHELQFELVNMNGQHIWNQKRYLAPHELAVYTINPIPSGIYYFLYSIGSKKKRKRFVIQITKKIIK